MQISKKKLEEARVHLSINPDPATARTCKNLETQDRTLTLLDRLVSEEDNKRLAEVPGAEELKELVRDLPSDKSPGEDGLSAEVLRELWDEISPGCLQFIQEVWHSK
ncbi:hypothetical protein R1flu_019398 [Riccia fluitans]|uniref:Uncharacterized protein n=1 Tax=Riccia fluitans TaxID=41844 RepID=A0ABD1ZIJ5_9MARC